jgi:hypothetical protein
LLEASEEDFSGSASGVGAAAGAAVETDVSIALGDVSVVPPDDPRHLADAVAAASTQPGPPLAAAVTSALDAAPPPRKAVTIPSKRRA